METRGILDDLSELKQLITENPNLPIAVLVGEQACDADSNYAYCTIIKCKIDTILDCYTPFSEYVYTDESSFDHDLIDYLYTTNEVKGLTEEEFDQYVEQERAKYAPYWKKAIIIYADN